MEHLPTELLETIVLLLPDPASFFVASRRLYDLGKDPHIQASWLIAHAVDGPGRALDVARCMAYPFFKPDVFQRVARMATHRALTCKPFVVAQTILRRPRVLRPLLDQFDGEAIYVMTADALALSTECAAAEVAFNGPGGKSVADFALGETETGPGPYVALMTPHDWKLAIRHGHYDVCLAIFQYWQRRYNALPAKLSNIDLKRVLAYLRKEDGEGFDLIRYMLTHGGVSVYNDDVKRAIDTRHYPLLHLFLDHGATLYNDDLKAAIAQEHHALVHLILDRNLVTIYHDDIVSALRAGDIPLVLNLLKNNTCVLYNQDLKYVLRRGLSLDAPELLEKMIAKHHVIVLNEDVKYALQVKRDLKAVNLMLLSTVTILNDDLKFILDRVVHAEEDASCMLPLFLAFLRKGAVLYPEDMASVEAAFGHALVSSMMEFGIQVTMDQARVMKALHAKDEACIADAFQSIATTSRPHPPPLASKSLSCLDPNPSSKLSSKSLSLSLETLEKCPTWTRSQKRQKLLVELEYCYCKGDKNTDRNDMVHRTKIAWIKQCLQRVEKAELARMMNS